MARLSRCWIVTVMAAVVLAVAGCRSSPEVAGMASAPEDFSIAVIVRGTVRGSSIGAGHFMVEPGGTFRVGGLAPGRRQEEVTPGRWRDLSPEEVQGLWTLVRDSGILDTAREAAVGSGADLPRQGVIADISVAYAGARRTVRRELDGPSADRGARSIVDRLAALARAR